MSLKKLSLNKETLKNLQPAELNQVSGGLYAVSTAASCSNPCPKTQLLCPHATTVPAGCPSTVSSSGCGLMIG
jgi:hypothetical protein